MVAAAAAATSMLVSAQQRRPDATTVQGPAMQFVGAQHWNESGFYADKGFRQHCAWRVCLNACANVFCCVLRVDCVCACGVCVCVCVRG